MAALLRTFTLHDSPTDQLALQPRLITRRRIANGLECRDCSKRRGHSVATRLKLVSSILSSFPNVRFLRAVLCVPRRDKGVAKRSQQGEFVYRHGTFKAREEWITKGGKPREWNGCNCRDKLARFPTYIPLFCYLNRGCNGAETCNFHFPSQSV